MKVVWWVLAGAAVVLASFNRTGNEDDSMSSGEDEDDGRAVAPLGPVRLLGPNGAAVQPIQIDPAGRMENDEVVDSSSTSDSSSDSTTEPILVENDNGQHGPYGAEDDDDGPRMVPLQFFPGEVLLNRLLDSQCDLDRLIDLLHICLQREDLAVFETACVACLQQYDPDDDRILEVLDMTIILGKPAYFEALLDGQCKSKIGQRVLTLLPSLAESFIAPAFRKCSAILPRHAVEVWREEYQQHKAPENGEEGMAVDWTRIDGITVDLHMQLKWPYKNGDRVRERSLAGLWARYSQTGEGTIGLLDQTVGEAGRALFSTKLGTGPSIFGLSNGPLLNLPSLLASPHESGISRTLENELYCNSSRFRAAVAMITPSSSVPADLSMYVERLTDGGPMILVYRNGDLLYPPSLQTYSADRTDLPLDTQIWAQPNPHLFLPISVSTTIPLLEGDIIVLAPSDTLQRLTPEIDLRGLMYCADKEGLPEIVGDFLKSLFTKTKQDVELAAVIVI